MFLRTKEKKNDPFNLLSSQHKNALASFLASILYFVNSKINWMVKWNSGYCCEWITLLVWEQWGGGSLLKENSRRGEFVGQNHWEEPRAHGWTGSPPIFSAGGSKIKLSAGSNKRFCHKMCCLFCFFLEVKSTKTKWCETTSDSGNVQYSSSFFFFLLNTINGFRIVFFPHVTLQDSHPD